MTVLREIIEKDFAKGRSKVNDEDDFYSVQEISRKQWDIKTVNDFFLEEDYLMIFGKPENNLDLYLIPVVNPIVSYSKVYLKFWKPLEYYAEFQLHCEPISENETKIEVITHVSRVHYFSFPVFSGHAYVNVKKVEPTSVEEYEILLRIGKLTGEKDMPSLKLPE